MSPETKRFSPEFKKKASIRAIALGTVFVASAGIALAIYEGSKQNTDNRPQITAGEKQIEPRFTLRP